MDNQTTEQPTERERLYNEALYLITNPEAEQQPTLRLEHLRAFADVAQREADFLALSLAAIIVATGKDFRAFVPTEVMARLKTRGIAAHVGQVEDGIAITVCQDGKPIVLPTSRPNTPQ